MQKTKVIHIGTKSFTVKELHMRQVFDLVNNEEQSSAMDRCQRLLKMGCPELDKDALLDLYPSEVEELWRAFEEVNAAFLGAVRLTGMDQVLIMAVKTAVASSVEQFASLLPVATVQ